MSSYRGILMGFGEALSTGNYRVLTNVLREVDEQLKILPTQDHENLVDDILSGGDGLLNFIKSGLKHNPNKKDSDDAFRQSFQFFSLLIDNFYQTTWFEQYIKEIKDICNSVLYKKCNFYIRKDAHHTFIKLIERFNNENLMLHEVLKKFVTSLYPLLPAKDRKLVYCVLGKIIKHNNNVELKYVEKIFQQLRVDAMHEFDSTNVEKLSNFNMYLDTISDMLDKAEPLQKEIFFKNVYKWIKSIVNSNKCQTNLLVSTIKLLNYHMKYFQNLLYPDYQDWHKVLQNLSNEKATSHCAQQALKTFYKTIGQILFENESRENSEPVLQYFLTWFCNTLTRIDLNLTTLQLTVYGYGRMAAACKKHLSEDEVWLMYSTITNRARSLCFSDQSDSASIEYVCYCQDTLSEILRHRSDVTNEQIIVLVQLSVYTIKRFPDLNVSNNALAVLSLIRVIRNLTNINRNLLQRYLDNIIYDGVAWSCSHTLAVDVELQQELENSKKPLVCYKNYLPLWTRLLNAKEYKDITVRSVAETLINVCVMLIDRLDIRVKPQYEDTTRSDVAFTHSAMNQADFRVFTNLVDLYVDLMDATNASLYTNIIPDFLHKIIRLSYKYPLISGFYRLIRAALKIFDCTAKEKNKETEKLISRYLVDTLELLPTFFHELLISCLYLILDAPGISYVTTAVLSTRLVPAFKIAFTIGLNNLELAYSALAALKTWTNSRQSQEDEDVDESLCEIVPYLESYLRSSESIVEISQELTVTRKMRLQRIGLIDTECTLRNFQRQVLLFLGSLDHDVLSGFLYKRSLNTGASWDRKNLLRYFLHLPNDTKIPLHLDRILPRVIALASNSSDRRTRIAACEVLHTMVTWVIILTSQRLSSLDESFVTALYTPLCPTLLALGCDSDEGVRGIFEPLALQLMHWLSSPNMLKSPMKPLVLDSLFDGLCDDANPSLREFAGACLAEFTSWLIKQQRSDEEERSNIEEIVLRINHFALHPATRKRVAAAVAFNHLYGILRENKDTISTYWLEMFYCFVRSMDGCEDPSIVNAVNHIENVMRTEAKMLNEADAGRRKPHDFGDATLTHALYWLLSQCAVLDQRCRTACKKLYLDISKYVIGGSARETTRNFVVIHGIDGLNGVILRDLNSNTEDISIADIKNLLKALDCYMWLIEEQLLPVGTLFPQCNDAQEHIIFGCIRNFARQFLQTAATRLGELDELQTLQCEAAMNILNFVRLLLNINDVADVLPESLWDESLFPLTIKCVMHPRAVGFDFKNIKVTDELPRVLEALLNTMHSRLNDTLASDFKRRLFSPSQESIPKLRDLRTIARSDSCDEQIQYVNGLIMLGRCNFQDRSAPEVDTFRDRVDTVEQIFGFLVNELDGTSIGRDVSAQMLEYLRALLKLQLLQYETPMVETLVSLMSTGTSIIGTDSREVPYGEYFLNTFSDVIFTYILTNVDAALFEKLHDKPSLLLNFTENALLYLKQHRHALREHINRTVDVILQWFARKAKSLGSHDTKRLISIYGTAVHLMAQPAEIAKRNSPYSDVHDWIVEQLTGSDDIEYKTQILRNFLVCLVDATDRVEDKRFVSYLYINPRQFLHSQLPSDMTVNVMKVVNCFETLLALLPATGSIILLNCLIDFAADAGDGAGRFLFNDKLKEHLLDYYRRETPGTAECHALRSLEMTYRKFTMNADVSRKFHVLHEFLLPAFDYCDSPTIERFFEHNIHELLDISQTKIVENETLPSSLASMIGCYELLTIMLTKLKKSKIAGVDSVIVRNAKLEKELLKALYRNAMNAQKIKVSSEDQGIKQYYVRSLHCSAYNFALAALSLKNDDQHYHKVFREDLSIWRNIIDCNKLYQLGQTVLKYPKYNEIAVNIVSSVANAGTALEAGDRGCWRIHSYDLTGSTLNEDLNAHDFNKCAVLSRSDVSLARERVAITNVILESDDFNDHRCMPSICGLLRRCGGLNKSKGGAELPKWLNSLVLVMQNEDAHCNIRLFMLKIIKNVDVFEVFKPYAKLLLPGVARAIANHLKNDDLNYIVTDAIQILIAWKDGISDEEQDNESKTKVRDFFEALVEKVLVQQRVHNKSVYNYNLTLIYEILKKWRCYLTDPIGHLIGRVRVAQAKIEEEIEAPVKNEGGQQIERRHAGTVLSATVDLLLKLLRDNDDVAREIVATNLTGIVDLLLAPLSDWKAAEEDILRYCECLGWYLELQRDGERDEEVKRKIFDILNSRPRTDLVHIEKQMKRVVTLCRTCPDLSADYITVVIDIACQDKSRVNCLEIFALAIPRLDTDSIMSCLHHVGLQDVLRNREQLCIVMALRVVHELVRKIPPADLLPCVRLAIPYLDSNLTEHRALVYDVLFSVYERYSADSDDVDATTLRSVSARSLLAALLDPSQELQERVLRFWTEETALSADQYKRRLIAVLDLRAKVNSCTSLKEEDGYALLVPLLILQLASRSRRYTEKMSDLSLFACSYEEYDISVSCRSRNLIYATPMFVSSLASQMSYYSVSQGADRRDTYSPASSFRRGALQVRTTQDSRHEPTAVDDEAAFSGNSLPDAGSSRPTVSSKRSRPMPYDKRFPRFLEKSSDVGEQIRNQHVRRHMERQELMKQENIRQRNSVELRRAYRWGDFPDVEIPHSSLIKTLQQLVKLDGSIRRDLSVCLLGSLIGYATEKEESDSFSRSIVESLKGILHNSKENSVFNAVILDTLLSLNVTDCNSSDVTMASKTNGLNALGVLLLERSLYSDASSPGDLLPTPEKRMKRSLLDSVDTSVDTNPAVVDKWMQLASLYKSIDDVDVVSSIFREQPYKKYLQEAAMASANGDWRVAKAAFNRAYKPIDRVAPLMNEHCMEGLFEAMDNLCDWSKVNKYVNKALGATNDIWNSSWRDWMMPRVCDAYVQLLIREEQWETIDSDMRMIQSWMEDPSRLEFMKSSVGEDLVILTLHHSLREASEILNDILDKTGEEWIKLSPLCTELGMRKLQKLQIMNDLDTVVKVLRCTSGTDYTDKLSTLLDFWTAKAPTMRDSLMQWNKLSACRSYALDLFKDRLINGDVKRNPEIEARLCRVDHRMRLSIVDAALKQGHWYVAQKYSNYLGSKVSADLAPRKTFLEARINYLCADLKANVHEKLHGYSDSWKHSHRLLNQTTNSNDGASKCHLTIAVREHIGALASTIEHLVRDNGDFADALLITNIDETVDEILQDIGASRSDDRMSVRRLLLKYSLDKFRSCSDAAAEMAVGRNVGKHYYALTRHYYNWWTDDWAMSEAEQDDIFQNFVLATLRAMYHGYHEAAHYLPYLLSSELLLRHEAAHRIFEAESVRPQPWLFLGWRDLLFSYLATPIASTVAPIVERLARTYPDAIAYTYLLAMEKNTISHDRTIMKRIREIMGDKVTEIERFLSAIRYVVRPELYIMYYLNEAEKKWSNGDKSAFTLLSDKLSALTSSTVNKRGIGPGRAFGAIAVYKNDISALDPTNEVATRKKIKEIRNSLRSAENKSVTARSNIKEYSPFLHAYAGGNVEVPGQYTNGNREPMPRYHVRIARIDPKVEVMRSLRRPIRISMIGENGREYKFLVKFGEDLTIDRGLQQLYGTMNSILSNDAVCRQRRLMIDTYEVIPLSESLGLIQWVEDTKSLKDLIWFTLSKEESRRCDDIFKDYEKWICNALSSQSRISDCYRAAAAKYDDTEVVTKLQQLINKTKQSALRDTFIEVSSSPESFLTLRRNFVASYATMCAAHWIVGIGDRHLQNTLVVVSSGRCLGIDFGHAFGRGIHSSVPELVPFRLTPQISQLLRPFTEKHLFGTIMTHVMRALRNDKGPILACMDIFAHKPVDLSTDLLNIENEDINTDSTWSFKKNIKMVMKKLNGIHPSSITLEELQEAHNKEYLTRYQTIVTGKNKSTQTGTIELNNCLTPTEQVNCLLDQATNPDILGRMWAGWLPWL